MQATLEHMSIWGLISDASLLVKAVMLTLLLASLLSWYLIIQRGAVLRGRELRFQAFIQRFRAAPELLPLYREVAKGSDAEGGVEPIFAAGYQEFSHLRGQPGGAGEGVLEGVERALYVAISEQETRLEKGLQFLATVGSVSPYIGLFGTVWGIMNSFLGLSQVQQATLSTVAPGIAEALIATAIGLFAAIPAVIAYNRFSARSQTLLTRYYAFGNELQVRLHRTLQGAPSHLAVAA
ncbi:cell division and transport-associated protein TolQ [Pseudomonas protegens]|jgi:biopolymer transport protein TolQ|uniref:Tol-Pal system protein TolQ n=1 Tax=Pseudomonas protegens (strain DSM 19095 / LMG 27888 / CFBP 6595 / CHA0) TaxID=1124983 RepID=A0A2C9EPE7_PSEPH|nr:MULTISPECIES: protein TolQ [Pseudomonas]GED77726.1 protein TolQ [Pseudomonas fluorescens]AGL85525.1 protein TolQ [Pseudomonas protegens CHA0]AQT10687.1 TonB system transport protein ExbB4 [Pseudomonas protegens]MBP5113632.1 protein TolQ [Pseudomonas protegens]MCS4258431.1 biopolymer transport protein TolQ [Pseudomonas sp. BIGb0176]